MEGKTNSREKTAPSAQTRKPKEESFILRALKKPLPSGKKPPSEQPIDLSSPTISHLGDDRKRMYDAANAVFNAGAITIAAASIFLLVLRIDSLLALEVSIPIFLGFSILIYEMLEAKN